MSQVAMDQPAGAAFTKTPNGAKYFQQQYETATQQPQQPPQQETPAAQDPMQVIAPPPSRVRQGILPQPKTYAPSAQPAQQQQAQPDTPSEAPAAAQPAPVLDPQMQQQLEAERQAFAQREQQWQQWAYAQNEQLAQAQAAQAELAKLQSREAIAQKFANNETFAGLETVDADDARKLIQLTAEAFEEPLKATSQQLQQMQQQQAQMQQYIAQQTAAMQSQRVRDELLTAHPDFFQLYQNNAAFRQFLNERDGLSYQTREQRAIAEYNAGNAPYLIDLINKFKGVSPSINNMKTVAPVQVAQYAATSQPAAPQTRYTLSDLIYFMQTGQMTQDQYREELNKLRAAQPA